MDNPRHPLVTRPWKTQQTQRTKWNLQAVKTGKEHGRLDSKGPKIRTSKTRKPSR